MARATVRRPADEAWSKIAAPLARGEAIRALFFGVTGSGKTTGAKHFLRYLVDRNLVDVVLIHDVKKREQQYDGEVIHEASHILTAEGAPKTFPAVRVMRKRSLDHVPSVESAARVTLQAGYDGIATLLVVDEFRWALSDGGKNFSAPTVRRVFCEGLGMKASILATKQLPQNTPTDATAQSAVVYFRTTTEGLNFLVGEGKVTDEQAKAIESLDVGEFVLTPFEGNFDGLVYEVPPP